MKLVVLSDIHGDYQRLVNTVFAERDADAIIFLGDGLRELDRLQDEQPALKIYAVRGNCDIASFAPPEAITAFAGKMILFTHGHLYGVKSGIQDLAIAAKAQDIDIALYGHTHCALHQCIEGVHLFNPGALSGLYGNSGTYGILTLEQGEAHFEHKQAK